MRKGPIRASEQSKKVRGCRISTTGRVGQQGSALEKKKNLKSTSRETIGTGRLPVTGEEPGGKMAGKDSY